MKTLLFSFLSLFVSITAYSTPFPWSNFYVGGFGGINFVNSAKRNDTRIDLDTGYVVGASLGYSFSYFFRLEGEVAYRENDFHQVVIDGSIWRLQESLSKRH